MPRRKLADEDAQTLVLVGLEGEVPVAELCRRYVGRHISNCIAERVGG